MVQTVRIEVFGRGELDGRATELLGQISQLGLKHVEQVHISSLFFLRGMLSPPELERLAQELLVDPVLEGYRWRSLNETYFSGESAKVIEVGFHPGVTDPVAAHLLRRAGLLGIGSLDAVSTGTRYTFEGTLSSEELHTIAREILCNQVIQRYTLDEMQPEFMPDAEPDDQVDVIPLRGLDDDQLARMSVDRVLYLSLDEMRTIRAEFRRLGRDPTDVELELLAQTWSEHCLHKTFKAEIDYTCHGAMPRYLPGGRTVAPTQRETIRGLLKTYLRGATDRLGRPWVRSAFVDNAGTVDFDDEFEISFKVETHNHPSALEPFGGANTGVGGVIRDVIGVSARPIANTDVLCFGPMDLPKERVPPGTLHPWRIARGVVAGIEDYGNKMGIPTVAGAILYDEDYVANPLVYCGCVGIARKGQHRTEPQTGDLCIAVGGRTGRDGLHGATFSSTALTHDTGQTVGSVVQIGDPITEKAMLEVIMQARDEGLYNAITDCGAGGFSSAAGEMGRHIGVAVDLQDVPLKYAGLRPWEIWLSEAQERMVLAVPEANLSRLSDICETFDVEWTVIGRFTGDERLRVCYGEKVVADLDMRFVHEGWPRSTLTAEWAPRDLPEPDLAPQTDYSATMLQMLAHPDIASKEEVVRRYDHEVQGATVIKPLVGVENDGPSDAAVLRPLVTKGWTGLAVGCGINPHYGRVDPYAMAWAVVDEALRNVTCVGADPGRVAILDNFCWGNPALPDRLGGLVRAVQGCHDAALTYGTPFISGKDSLNNEYVDVHGKKRTIPPTLLISSLGIVPDVRHIVTMDLKEPGNLIYVVGETKPELGGSLYFRLNGALGNSVPTPVPDAPETMHALFQTARQGYVRAMHDLSEGGLGVAAAEMCIAGRLGLELRLSQLPRSTDLATDAAALFSESSARFLVEVAPENVAEFEQAMASRPCAQIGRVTEDTTIRVQGLKGQVIVKVSVDVLRQAWQAGLIL
jgi:phosphoribosylformylglycinamidine synthase